MIAVLVLHGALGALLVVVGNRLSRSAFVVAAVAPLTATVWACARYRDVTGGEVLTERVEWVGGLGLSLDLRLDGLALTMALIVAGIGVLVLVYGARYVDADAADAGRLAGLLVLFAGAMLGLVLADHLIALYGFWEVTSVLSYFLIAHKFRDPGARAAALHALLVTAAGGLAMLGGFIVLRQEAGTYLLSELAAGPRPAGVAVGVALALVLLGAFTKSAQYPFQAWLPAAMVAPTPVSAYLHSATMVKAGVYLVARLAPVFAAAVLWRPAVFVIGLVTLVMGGLRALQQHDLKLLLAYGTVSQLGLMIVLFGAGTPALAIAGWVLLGAHAAFKAAMFMVVGILERQTGTRDLRELPALGARWRWVEGIALVSAVSMAGAPIAIGFVAKEEIYGALADASFAGSGAVFAVVVAGSMLTVAYAARFYVSAFVMPRRRARATGERLREVIAPAWVFWAPAAVLALASVALGVAPQLEDSLANAVARSFAARRPDVHLELWHGLNLPLVLSVVTIVGGILVWAIAGRTRWFTIDDEPAAARVYPMLLRALAVVSRQVTGVVQNGSLPVYAGVILATAAILPGAALVSSWTWSGWPAVVGPIATVPIVAILAVTAFAAATIRRRFSAAVFLGATGYAMAALFVLRGAPDLALTQVAIETLSTVLFVLVLRRLPDRFERQSTPVRRVVRLAIAGLVGVTVFVFAIAASGVPADDVVSDELISRALPDGHGRNVVNVILVDFRGLDTFGEITVLAVASIGAVALARAVSGGRRRRLPHEPDAPERGSLPRVVFVDVSAQIVFYAVLMGSLWLLFAGHDQPGGGFVAGLLAGSAISLRYVAGGIGEVRGLSRFRPWTVLGSGLGIAAATAAAPLLAGDGVLDVATASVTLPLFGTVDFSSSLAFDVGVFLTVIGMVLMVFEAFGDDPGRVPR